jgi:hypothetical protein
MAPPRLNIDIFRIRHHFAERGVVDGMVIIERRLQQRQIRIGTGRISIVRV